MLPHRALAGFLLLLAAMPGVAGAEPSSVDRDRSWLVAVIDKAGLLSFFGHRHAIEATEWSARLVYDPGDPARASVEIEVAVRGLRIDSDRGRRIADLPAGPDADTVRELQAKMLGAGVLDAARYPAIAFRSTSVEAGRDGALVVRGRLSLHGRSSDVSIPVRVERLDAGALRFSGAFTVRQTDHGIAPESVGGVVKVADPVTIRFDVVTTSPPRGHRGSPEPGAT